MSMLTLDRTAPSEADFARERDVRRFRKCPDLWMDRNFYEPESAALISLLPFQRAVLRYATQRSADGELRFRTVLWSQVKKSGKTALSGAIGRWAAETWGRYQLVMFVGNDADQAKERGFAALKASVELTPGYNRKRRELPDKWTLRDAEAQCSNGSTVKAIAADYTGEAGANPSLTVYTELWGFIHEAARRFWAEMAPSPTRKNSMRWVETYAGYEGESELLWGLYESGVTEARQLTAGDLMQMFTDAEREQWALDSVPLFAEAPNPDDLVPCYVNDAAGIFAFWDSGEQARRMPWQQGPRGASYYANEAATQTPAQMQRLHLNEWVSGESPFIELPWWDACMNPLPLVPGEKTPLVVGVDAAVTNDCFGVVVVSRDPNNPAKNVAIRAARKWSPPPGGEIDFAEPEAYLKWLYANFNVVQFCYDHYQLASTAQRMRTEGIGWWKDFPQGAPRLDADKLLFDLIRDRRLRHDGNMDIREHLANCAAKLQLHDDSRIRIIKKAASRKIDLVIAMSMSAYECLRLSL